MNRADIEAGALPPVPFIKVFANTTSLMNAGALSSLYAAPGAPAASVQVPIDASAATTYLARMVASASQRGTLVLYDRLWDLYGGFAGVGGAQNVNSSPWPARDKNGSTNGDGVMVALEWQTSSGVGSPMPFTMSYTNQAGVAGRTGAATAVANAWQYAFTPFSLQGGDTGVRSIQTITSTSPSGAGTWTLIVYREIATLELPRRMKRGARDAVALGLPRLFSGVKPALLWLPTDTAVVTVQGEITFTRG